MDGRMGIGIMTGGTPEAPDITKSYVPGWVFM